MNNKEDCEHSPISQNNGFNKFQEPDKKKILGQAVQPIPPYVPKEAALKEIIDEAEGIKTFVFKTSPCFNSEPGQFVMLYLPGIGERPFSIYAQNNESFSLTIAKVGKVTSHIFNMNKGQRLYYLGPFGKPFKIKGSHIALVAGGYGAGPLSFLAKKAASQGIRVEFIIGAKSKKYLLYLNKAYPEKVNIHYCTDDGSFGFNGFATEKLKELLLKYNHGEKGIMAANPEKQSYIFVPNSRLENLNNVASPIDMAYSVGPELMMKKVVEITDSFDIGCQVSLERHMKCGFGICGSCSVDPIGIRMCVEGPCLDKKTVKKITEFGKYKRGPCGEKIYF